MEFRFRQPFEPKNNMDMIRGHVAYAEKNIIELNVKNAINALNSLIGNFDFICSKRNLMNRKDELNTALEECINAIKSRNFENALINLYRFEDIVFPNKKYVAIKI